VWGLGCRVGVLSRNVKRFQGGLLFKAHRLLYYSILGLRVTKKKKVWGDLDGFAEGSHEEGHLTLRVWSLGLFFFFTLVTGPRRSLSLKLSDTEVYEPQIRARLGNHNTTILGFS